jgi:hypothetical protein
MFDRVRFGFDDLGVVECLGKCNSALASCRADARSALNSCYDDCETARCRRECRESWNDDLDSCDSTANTCMQSDSSYSGAGNFGGAPVFNPQPPPYYGAPTYPQPGQYVGPSNIPQPPPNYGPAYPQPGPYGPAFNPQPGPYLPGPAMPPPPTPYNPGPAAGVTTYAKPPVAGPTVCGNGSYQFKQVPGNVARAPKPPGSC